ncbi:MAG: OmpA family protein [Alcaligenaceae bacterium]|nr:OmpA family protein [Alcaligenaceae bacterium]
MNLLLKRFFMMVTGLTVAVALAGCATANRNYHGLTLGSDLAFKFGKSELTPAAKEMIDEYAAIIDRTKNIRVAVVGHTDRIGDDQRNQVLALERAEAVRTQLLESRLEPRSVFARSVGSSEPVVQCDQTDRKALIECLAPNRRVEVFVNPTAF